MFDAMLTGHLWRRTSQGEAGSDGTMARVCLNGSIGDDNAHSKMLNRTQRLLKAKLRESGWEDRLRASAEGEQAQPALKAMLT